MAELKDSKLRKRRIFKTNLHRCVDKMTPGISMEDGMEGYQKTKKWNKKQWNGTMWEKLRSHKADMIKTEMGAQKSRLGADMCKAPCELYMAKGRGMAALSMMDALDTDSCTKQGGAITHNQGKVALRQIRCGHFRNMKQNTVKMTKDKDWENLGHDGRKEKLECECGLGPQDMYHIVFECMHTKRAREHHTKAYEACLTKSAGGVVDIKYNQMNQTERMRCSINMKAPGGGTINKTTRHAMYKL